MVKYVFICFVFILLHFSNAQKIEVLNTLVNKSSFVYLFKHNDYQTNQNTMLTRTAIDSFFFKFTKISTLTFDLDFYLDSDCKIKYNLTDSTYLKTYTFKFNDSGKLISFVNVNDFRKKILNFEKSRYNRGDVSFEYYEEQKANLKNDLYVLNTINADFANMWNPVGDTFNMQVSRIRIRSINSPITKQPMFVNGNVSIENFENSNILYKIKARHPASPEIKQELVAQLKKYIANLKPDKLDKRTEIKEVTLNAEQDWIYNNNIKMLTTIFLSDIFVVNGQGRGVVRAFELWDYTD